RPGRRRRLRLAHGPVHLGGAGPVRAKASGADHLRHRLRRHRRRLLPRPGAAMRQFLLDMIGGAFWAATWLVWALIAASAWGQEQKPDPLIGRPFDNQPTSTRSARLANGQLLKWSKKE